MFAGHVIVGGCVSFTVTVKEHDMPPSSRGMAPSVHVTVVVPTGKNEPAGGVQVTGLQLVAIGGG